MCIIGYQNINDEEYDYAIMQVTKLQLGLIVEDLLYFFNYYSANFGYK